MTEQQDICVGLVLDESGSMQNIAAETISSLNEYIKSLCAEPVKVQLSLTMFSTSSDGSAELRPYCTNKDVKDVSEITSRTYQPRGFTPLYDAVGSTITSLEVPEGFTALFVILTDGHENASREYTKEKVADLIKGKEADGWRFIFMGADLSAMDAAHMGAAMGMHANSTMSYAKVNTRGTTQSLYGATHSASLDPTLSSADLVDQMKDEEKKK